MSNFLFTPVSSNKKTGPIPTTMTHKGSCSIHCPLMSNGCYAENFPLSLHWNNISTGKTGISGDELIAKIKALPRGQLWRHNVAGDLPQKDGIIDREFLLKLIDANKRKKGFTYSHHELTALNLYSIRLANSEGFTINISTNTINDGVATFKGTGLPTVTLLPTDAPNQQTVRGVNIVACPAEKSAKVSCATCGLCAISDRDYIIGFRAHGVKKKAANLIATSEV